VTDRGIEPGSIDTNYHAAAKAAPQVNERGMAPGEEGMEHLPAAEPEPEPVAEEIELEPQDEPPPPAAEAKETPKEKPPRAYSYKGRQK
jgi:hypothetical protein